MFQNISFLNKIDKTLLLNYPKIWVSKIHYVAFYGVILWILSAALGLIIPINPSNTEDLGLWYFLLSIIAFILFCFWIYRYVIFNNEKKHGLTHWSDAFLNFSLASICVAIYTFTPIPFSMSYNYRVAHYVSDDDFFNDVNTLNSLEVYMMNDQNYYYSYYDSVKQVNLYDYRKLVNNDPNTPWRIRYDSLKYPKLLSAYQQKINFKLSTNEIEIKNYIKTYFEIEQKYRLKETFTEEQIELTYQKYKKLTSESPMEGYSYEYFDNNHYQLERALSNISEAKFDTLFVWKKEFMVFLMYSIFYSTLLINLFKLVPWRQYLVSIITIVILPIILFIFSQLLPYDSGYNIKQNSFSILLALAILVAIITTVISIFNRKKFNAFYNICSQISYLSFAIFPLLILSILKEMFGVFYYNFSYSFKEVSETMDLSSDADPSFQTKEYFMEQLMTEYWQNQYNLWFNIVMFSGIILFILIVLPLLQKELVKQLSLPKKS
jgi:hypothetical protein